MPSMTERPVHRPCVVLAHMDATYASETGRKLRRLGWDVYPAKGGPEARRLARMLDADLVVLGVDLGEESGWLTCAKLTRERPGGKVVLVGPQNDTRSHNMAAFVGASALVPCQESLAALVQQGMSPPMSAAG